MGLLEWVNVHMSCVMVMFVVESWAAWVASLAHLMTFERSLSYVKWA